MNLVTLLEVQEVVNQMADGKAPGPYGFTINFFHHFWDPIKIQVWKIVENSRLSNKILLDFYATFITLIPKSDGAESLS